MFYPESTCLKSDYDDKKSEKIDFENDILFGMKSSEQFSSAHYGQSWKHGFVYDLLLIYDSNTDYLNAQDLLPYIQRQNLRIVDFARDCPAGKNERTFLAEALKECKYTCIVVTRNFLSNMWLKFKTDMAIQDMLLNENKRYTVIVVVMDRSLEQKDIPLDLQTLCPIFQSERYFTDRISKAFHASMPFGKHSNSVPSSSIGSHSNQYSQLSTLPQQPSDSHIDSRCNNEYNSSLCSPSKQHGESFHFSSNSFGSDRPKVVPALSASSTRNNYDEWLSSQKKVLVEQPSYASHNVIDKNRNLVNSHFSSLPMPLSQQSLLSDKLITDIHSHSDSETTGSLSEDNLKPRQRNEALGIKSRSETSIMSRVPQEHTDTPQPWSHPLSHADFQRLISVTKKSNGLRQPIETDDRAAIATPSLYSQSPVTSLPANEVPASCAENCQDNIRVGGQIRSNVTEAQGGHSYALEPTTFHFSDSLQKNKTTTNHSSTQSNLQTIPTFNHAASLSPSRSNHCPFPTRVTSQSPQLEERRRNPTSLQVDHPQISFIAPGSCYYQTGATQKQINYSTAGLAQKAQESTSSSPTYGRIPELSISPTRKSGSLQSTSYRERTSSPQTIPTVNVSNYSPANLVPAIADPPQIGPVPTSIDRRETGGDVPQASVPHTSPNRLKPGTAPVQLNVTATDPGHMTESFDSIEEIEVEISDEEIPRTNFSPDENSAVSDQSHCHDHSLDSASKSGVADRSSSETTSLSWKSLGKSFVERFKRRNR